MPLPSKQQQGKTYPAWHNFVAGGFAGAGSRVATAPLDLIRIRRQLTPVVTYPSESLWQTWIKIVQNEGGVAALFRGNLAAIYLWVGYSAVQFSLYRQTRDRLTELEVSASAAAFCAGAWAGTCATLATYPFDVCRTTFAARGIIQEAPQPAIKRQGNSVIAASTIKQSAVLSATTTTSSHQSLPDGGRLGRGQPVPFSSLVEPHYNENFHHAAARQVAQKAPPKTLTDFAIQLYSQKGIRGFYAGAGPATIQIIPYMGLNFMLYDFLVAGDKRVKNSGYAGAFSGAVSKIIVYPIDTVKRRLQAQAFYDTPIGIGRSNNRQYTGMVDCFLRVTREEGIRSLYRGMVPSVLKTTIASSLSFALFRFGKNTAEWMHDRTFDR